MTSKEFFEQQSTTDANSVINKHEETYNRFDLIRFAQSYHDSEVKKLNTPDVRLSYPLSSSLEIWQMAREMDSSEFRKYYDGLIKGM